MRRTFVLASLFLLALFSAHAAEARRAPPPPPPQPQPTVQWDSRGWTMVGEQTVSGYADRDVINVGRYEGRFSKLTLVVLDSDLELLDFTINFVDGTRYEPRVQHFFRENARTRAIDLPPNGGLISRIDLKYRNIPGGGRARVQVWGFRVDAPAPPPPPPAPPQWDSRGWVMLGEQPVNGRLDRDAINVGRREGRFSKLTLVVLDDDLELLDFTINFVDGTRYEPRLQHYFRENARTRAIDLPPNGGVISRLDLKYRNIPGGGRARVQVWGLPAAGPGPGPTPGPVWDSRGWELIGEQTVDGRFDRDRINVGREMGRFSKLTVVVLDSDLEMIAMEVAFRSGPSFKPQIAQFFRENTRTRAIDLPDNMRGPNRIVEYINFKYKNLARGGRARVQVWGYQPGIVGPGPGPGPGPAPGPVWDSRGWELLGEQTVAGRVDRDRINVGREAGRFSKLMVVVLDSDLEMIDMEVNFRRGAPFKPAISQFFREGTRTRAIDLPDGYRGADRTIEYIDFKYKNLPGGGRARVQVWGSSSGASPGPAPGPVWDSRGWELLGEQTVAGRVDRDRINVGREAGRFSKLMVVVLDSDLEMIDMEVNFRRGAPFKPAISQFFREGTRTRAIDLPEGYRGADRTIEYIDFKYKNLPGGGRARVQVWGTSSGGAGPGPAPAPAWDSRGWTMLGEQTVSGRFDRDRINVGRDMGKFSKLMVVVLDSDLEMIDMEVSFRRGQPFKPAISQFFREGTRTRSIDLPDGYRGSERTIEFIDFKYKNLPGGGRARVQVWGQ